MMNPVNFCGQDVLQIICHLYFCQAKVAIVFLPKGCIQLAMLVVFTTKASPPRKGQLV